MIKKLSIIAGISLVLFGVADAVVAQQAKPSRFNPLGKISETFGSLKNTIKKSLAPQKANPRSATMNQSRRHITGRRPSTSRSRSNGLLGALVPRMVPNQSTRNNSKNSSGLQDAPRYNPNHQAPAITANRPAKINSSRRNPGRFIPQTTPQEVANNFQQTPRPNPTSSAIASDANRSASNIVNSPPSSPNLSEPMRSAKPNSVLPGGYKSLRDRLRTARMIIQGNSSEAQIANSSSTQKSNSQTEIEPQRVPTVVQTPIEKRPIPQPTEVVVSPKPTDDVKDRPIRVESAPQVANQVKEAKLSESKNPIWNSTNTQASVLKKKNSSSENSTEKISSTLKTNEPSKTVQINSTKKTSSSGNNISSKDLIDSDSPVISVKTIGPKSINIGKTATYKINISNLGRSAANDVVVNVKIPAWTSINGVSPSVGTTQQGQGSYQWLIKQLPGGRTETLTVKLVPLKSRPFSLGIQWGFAPKASDTVVQVLEPKLKLELTGSEEIYYGKTRIFKLTVSNPGTGNAENVALSVQTAGRNTSAHQRVLGILAAGESKTMQLKMTATQAGTLLIRASVKSDGGLSDEVSKKILVRRAGLKVVMSGPKKKFAGTPATYKIRISNPGNASANNIRITAQLPTGTKYGNSTAGMFYKSNNQVTWKIDSLQAGADRLLQVRCVLDTAGKNQILVRSEAETDLTDSTSISTNVEALADLKLEVIDPRGPIAVGELITYEIRIRNRGSRQAEKVQVKAYFSQGIDATSATGAKFQLGNNGEVVFSPISKIAANDDITLKVTAKAKVAGNHHFQVKLTCKDPQTSLSAQETTRFYTDDDQPTKKLSRIPATTPNVSNRPAFVKRKNQAPEVILDNHNSTVKPIQYRATPPHDQAPTTKNIRSTQKPARFNPSTIDLTPINTLPR